jgi:hypothetical protein
LAQKQVEELKSAKKTEDAGLNCESKEFREKATEKPKEVKEAKKAPIKAKTDEPVVKAE